MADELRLAGVEELFGTDATKEEGGVWVDLPTLNGAPPKSIKIRSSNSTRLRNVAAKIARRHMALFRIGKNPPAAEQDKDRVEMVVATIMDWKGFARESGDALPCNADVVRSVMTTYPQLAAWVIQQSDAADNFRREEREALEGNSATPSGAL